MNKTAAVVSLLFSIVMATLVSSADAQDTKKLEPKASRPLIQISCGKPTTAESGESTVKITLEVDPGVAIYTNEPHVTELKKPYLIPLSIEFLDKDGEIVDAKLTFPIGTVVKSSLGDYRVYTGKIKVAASFSNLNSITLMRTKIFGYHFFSGNVESGYS